MPRGTESISSSQRVILEKFKSNLKDILTSEYSDVILLRWLKTRNFNLKETEQIFRWNFFNRIVAGVKDLLDTYEKPEVVQLYESAGVIGFAKDGTLIRYVGAGRVDFYGYLMSMSSVDLCLYFSYIMETDLQALKEENLRTGKEVNEITYILDLEGFSIQQVLHQNVIEAGFDYTRLMQECYPLVWSNIFIVNAPTIFSKAFTLFKPVIYSGALEKMKIVSKESTKELLLEYIDEEVLPAFLGGKKVDSNGDPYCKEFLSFGGKVAEKFYSSNSRIPLLLTDPEVKYYAIGPRSAYNYPVVVKECNIRIRVQASSSNGSLYVAVFYKKFETDSENPEIPGLNDDISENGNSKYKQVTVSLKYQAHCCQEDAIMHCKWPGIYVIRLINSGSWFTSKKILVRTEKLTPK